MKNKSKVIFIIIILILAVVILLLFKLKNNSKTDDEYSNKTFEQNEDNTSAINVNKNIDIINDKIIKTGDSDDLSESDRTGKNAAILVNTKNSIKVADSEINTEGNGASGIAITERGASADVGNTTITTTKERSKGILASNAAKINVKNTIVNTEGDKSSAVATDFGGGTINVSNSELNTHGAHSAGIYSTGNIEVSDTNINTDYSTAAVIDGNGRIVLNNSNLTSGGKRAVYIYYTGTNPRDNVIGRFKMENGSLTSNNGPAFYVTNTKAIIELENVDITTNTGIILKAISDSSDLGMENEVNSSKGGDATLIATGQVLNGGIEADNQSTLDISLQFGSYFKGYINKDNTAKYTKLTVKSGCIMELTDNCYIDELELEDGAEIIYNGYEIIK